MEKLVQNCDGGIKLNILFKEQACPLPVLRNKTDPSLHGLSGCIKIHLFPVHPDGSACFFPQAENTFHGFTSASTNKAGQSQDFPLAKVKAYILYNLPIGKV